MNRSSKVGVPSATSRDLRKVAQQNNEGYNSRVYMLGLLTLVYGFNFIDRQLLVILQESIRADLSLSDSQLGLLSGFAFAFFYVIAGLPIARWADYSNRRNIIALATFLWSFMTILSGFAQNYLQLFLARVGVGLGEAGGTPPSHAIISDIYPLERRAGAISFFSMGANIGIIFGFLGGGWLNELFGWRITFLVVGIPGIVLATLVRFTLKEPTREMYQTILPPPHKASFSEIVSLLWNRNSFRHMALAAALTAYVVYASANWMASLMIRSHGVNTGELGTWLALIMGFGGAVGVYCGGLLADRLSLKDVRWYMWTPAISGLLSLPFIVGVFLAEDAYTALGLLVIPGLLSNVFLGTCFATLQGLVGTHMRATASAILIFIINIIGLGAGAWSIGILSDALAPSLGVESLRHAMLYLLPPITAWSIFHYILAAKYLRKDLEAAPS